MEHQQPPSPNPQLPPPLPQSQIHPQSKYEPSPSMDFVLPQMDQQPDSTLIFDWGDLLDFGVSGEIGLAPIPFPASPLRLDPDPIQAPVPADRVRKRDPRATCENFLAGRVPCACPELDALLAEEEELRGPAGKKRVRTMGRAVGVGALEVRCQVPGCEVDISELKGYHKRHKVCLKCANASEVVMEGESRRYCQQCGKFHILSDFDKGKRSCRRKLERHNNRRRKKHTNSKGSTEEESIGDPLIEEISCDIETGKASVTLKTAVVPYEDLVRSEDEHVANLCSALGSQEIRGDSPGSDEANMDGTKDSSKYGPSSSNGDNKSAFSSFCPTGRISFKLYDWNPAEFPRRLRHQIFQWLANMPVELEGYVRPGCTILTVFLSMPRFMWVELLKDPASQLQEFISAPGRLLSGKGTIHVYLDNMRFQIARDGTFVKKVPINMQAPRLHYVHPTFFEAGKPMEFVACGSNLLQPKFRFLISFQEKYVSSESYLSFSRGQLDRESVCNFGHQQYKIYAPLTDSNVFGPAFIEVDNESGLTNYITVLIGDKEVCAEMEKIQQKCVSVSLLKSVTCEVDSCEVLMAKHATLSEFVEDIAWLLKEPISESVQVNLTSSQIKRYDSVLNYLISNDSTAILDRVLKSLSIRMKDAEKSNPGYGTCESDVRVLQNTMNYAIKILEMKRVAPSVHSLKPIPNDVSKFSIQEGLVSTFPESTSLSLHGFETVPLLSKDDSVKAKLMDKWPRQSCSSIMSSSRRVQHTRATVSLVAVAIVCFGVCAVILHPQKVGQLAVTVRRCLFDRS